MLASVPTIAAASDTADEAITRLSSARAPDREAALLVLGDDGLPGRRQQDAVVRMLSDPVAAVRWNAIAALYKAGPEATAVLLPLLSDTRPSMHVASFDGGCGRVPFVPTYAELAAAVLSALPEAEHGPLWTDFRTADTPRRELLEATLLAAARPPKPSQLHLLLDASPHERQLLLRLAPARQLPIVLEALSAVLTEPDPRRDSATERQLAEAVSQFGEAGAPVAAKALASSIYPEVWLQEAPREGVGWDAVRTRALRDAGLSGRTQALRAAAEVLSTWAAFRGSIRGEATPPDWVVQAGPASVSAVLSQTADGSSVNALVGAARLFVRVPEVRPMAADVLVRATHAAEDSNHVAAVETLSGLAVELAAEHSVEEARQLWESLLRLPVRRVVDGAGGGASAWATVVARLQPPPIPLHQDLASKLLKQVLEGRLPAGVLAQSGDGERVRKTRRHRSLAADQTRASWRAALRAALPGSGLTAGREADWARILAALDEPPSRVDAAWFAAARSGLASDSDITEALVHLAKRPSTRNWARRQIVLRLHRPADAAEAQKLIEAAWPSEEENGGFWLDGASSRRAAEARWSKIAKALPVGSAGRAYGLARILEEYHPWLRGAAWRDRAIDALSSAEGEAVGPLLTFLTKPWAGADPTQQALSCDQLERNELPDDAITPLSERRRAALTGVLRRSLAAPGEQNDLAVRVWRGHRLSADAAVEALHRKTEQTLHAQCDPDARSRVTPGELQVALAAGEGQEGRADLLSQALQSRYEATVCAALQALPSTGADGVRPAAGLLRRWMRPLWSDVKMQPPQSCSGQSFNDALAKTLRQFRSDRRREVIESLLAEDSMPLAASPQLRRGKGRYEGAGDAPPFWRPDALAAEILQLEGSSDDLPPLDPVFEALRDVLPASLHRRLSQGKPGPLWVMLARSQWLRSKPHNRLARSSEYEGLRGPPADEEPEVIVEKEVAPALPLLARHWPSIEPTLRRGLLPLLAAAPPTAPWLRDMLTFSAENPTAGERKVALRMALKLWGSEAEWIQAAQAELIADSIIERLGPRLDEVFDLLRRPTIICTSGSMSLARLPAMAWPPPPGYRPPQPIPLSQFGPPGLTAGAWYERMRTVFQSLSANFETGLFSGPPGGFALVARLERIDETGTPFPDPARWTSQGQAKLHLGDLMRDLFLERPGRFRIVVFVVTTETSFQADASAQLPELSRGAQVMPKELADQPLDGKHVLALVYPFERPRGAAMRIWRDGGPSTLQHLQAAGLWQKLQALSRP
jgi:hypothetical protein